MSKDVRLTAFERENREYVRSFVCSQCYAAPGLTCFTGRRFREASHLPRIREAIRHAP